ncbi:hypothetical protein FQN50_002327 [Emmonsiellopsis sp. PD_5]|nr:hypothetical protein FQN50_002327 [Emmonsiellopsis sp. PD_5]
MHPLFVIFFGFLATSHGYLLDPSCTRDRSIETLVVDGLRHAFDTASAAEDALRTRPWTRNDNGPIMDLADWILKEDGSAQQNEMHAWPPTSPTAPLRPNDPRNRLDKARDVFNLMLMNRVRTDREHSTQFKVFCDLDRFKTSTRQVGKVWDSVLNVFSKDAYITLCQNPFVQAWTLVEQETWKDLSRLPQESSEIKIPIFSPAGRFADDESRCYPASNPTVMDIYGGLMDTVLIHEMTHTSFAGNLDDVKANGGPYRWKNILTKTPEDSIKNADSVAYFALGARMIRTQGYKPNRDGSLTRM